jgi:RNA polymerase sigma-70 factor, ECF subfamily
VTDDRVIKIGRDVDTSSSLLVRMRENDPEGWARFVRLYSPLVYRWCRKYGLREDFAADIGQEVFQAVASAIARYHHDQQGDTFRGWLRTITMHKVWDFLRAQPVGCDGAGGSDALMMLHGISDKGLTPDDSQEDELVLLRQAIEIILPGYDETTRQAFWRVVVDGHDPADVARELGLTVNAVYLAKSRITHRLREEFAGLIDLM